jgi:hypothetical protein
MNRGRVGEERGSKEMDRCPLTMIHTLLDMQAILKPSKRYIKTTSGH